MACDTVRKPNQTLLERASEVERALRRLRAQLLSGAVRVKVAPNGAIAFVGWNDRDGLTDACSFRVLSYQNSYELKQAVQRAETLAGRKVDPRAVLAGHHSHDGGKTWERH